MPTLLWQGNFSSKFAIVLTEISEDDIRMNKTLLLLPVLLGILATPAKTLAHAMETNFQFLDKLEFQSVYSSGEPAKKAKVIVYAPNNPDEPWMVGETDEQGKFSFLPDKSIPGDWEVEFEQEGHGDILTVPVNEKGVDVDNISQVHSTDIHYGATPLNPLQSILITAGVGATWFLALRKRQA